MLVIRCRPLVTPCQHTPPQHATARAHTEKLPLSVYKFSDGQPDMDLDGHPCHTRAKSRYGRGTWICLSVRRP
jgi:hypothetical protein